MFRTRYRIVTDAYAGYAVEHKRWWWPFWTEMGLGGEICNTHPSVEKAEAFARRCQGRVVKEVPAHA